MTVRELRSGDAAAVYAAVDVSRPELEAWMSWCTPSYSFAATEAWVEYAVARAVAGRGRQYVVEEAQVLVGVVGFEDIRESSATVGYWIATPYTGRGLGRRAVRAAVALAEADLRLDELVALVADRNARSRRLIEGLGFAERQPRVAREVGVGVRQYVLAVRRDA